MLTSDPLTDSIRDLWYYDCNELDSIGFVSNLTPSCQLAMTHQTYMSYFCYYTCNRLSYQTYAESHWMLEAHAGGMDTKVTPPLLGPGDPGDPFGPVPPTNRSTEKKLSRLCDLTNIVMFKSM